MELAGTTVQRVSGYNARYIKENHIMVNTVVSVCKRGEIIPAIQEVIDTDYEKEIDLPTHCKHCGTKI